MVWCKLALDLLRNGLRWRKDRTGQPNARAARAARGFLRAIQAEESTSESNILILFDKPGMIDGS